MMKSGPGSVRLIKEPFGSNQSCKHRLQSSFASLLVHQRRSRYHNQQAG